MGRRDADACEVGGFEQMRWWVLPDHADAFCEFIERGQDVLGESIEELVQITKERAVGLPVVVLVAGVQYERIGNLAAQFLHDLTVGRTFSRQVFSY
jgi:hypothetical protein